MRDCWKFFRYAKLSDTDIIIKIFKNNKWLSKYNYSYVQNKIKKSECIYESGVIINFALLKKKTDIGNISVQPNNTLLEQIVRENLSLKNNYAYHVFTKFLNCTVGNTYLSVDASNHRAIRFYEKTNMVKLDEYVFNKEKKRMFVFAYYKNYT